MSENPQYPPPAEGQYQQQQPYQQPYPPPQPGYPAQQPGVAQPMSDSDQRLWAMLAHIGGILTWFIGSLVIMMVFGERSAFVKRHAVEALNFQITLTIAWFIAGILSIVLIGLVLLPIIWIGEIVFCIIAGLAANKGQEYRYPINIRLVK
jgi:uncharacterized Tic20 family protein